MAQMKIRLVKRSFDYNSGNYAEVVGYYKSLYAGHVSEQAVRKKVTSGGILTYTLSELLASVIWLLRLYM